jgi:hypothetical protein
MVDVLTISYGMASIYGYQSYGMASSSYTLVHATDLSVVA